MKLNYCKEQRSFIQNKTEKKVLQFNLIFAGPSGCNAGLNRLLFKKILVMLSYSCILCTHLIYIQNKLNLLTVDQEQSLQNDVLHLGPQVDNVH